jgi:hypothetical protein
LRKKIPGTVGPEVPLFKKFHKEWSKIDKTKFTPGIRDTTIAALFLEDKEIIVLFPRQMLQNQPARADYKEFLELCLVFLGELPGEKLVFRPPGAMHHARWMSKVLYSLKIFLFQNVFKLTPSEDNALSQITVFIVKIYVRVWFAAPLSISAPNADFGLLQELHLYKSIDPEISDAGLRKFVNHLWYLNKENIAFAFFDESISDSTKEKMRAAIWSEEEDHEDNENEYDKRVHLQLAELEDVLKNGLEQFVSSKTKNFFKRFDISLSFLLKPCSEWAADANFLHGREIVSRLKVINDAAERGVRLIAEYQGMTKDEEQQQFILQIVNDYRKNFPDVKKNTLMSNKQ